MLSRIRQRLKGAGRKPLRTALVVLLAGAVAAGGYYVGRQVWLSRHLAAARLALEHRDFGGAQGYLAPCLETCPGNAEVHLLAARVAWQTGKPEEARQHLVRCEQLGGDYEAVVLEFTLLRVQSGDTAHGEGFLLERASKGHPDTAVMLEALLRGYAKTFRYRQAQAVVDLWLKQQPENARAWYWHGQCQEHLGNNTVALTDYGRSVELDGTDDEARRCLAERLLFAHQSAAALKQFQHLRERHAEDADVLLGITRCQLDAGEARAALQTLDALPSERRETGPVLTVHGAVLGKLGRQKEALPVLRRAVELLPTEPEVVYSLAACLTQLHQTEEAAAQLARWKQLNDDLKQVGELAHQVQANPRDADLRYQLGVIYLRVGRESEGIAWLLSALQEDPGHAATHEELARYYERKGDRARAEQHRQSGHTEQE